MNVEVHDHVSYLHSYCPTETENWTYTAGQGLMLSSHIDFHTTGIMESLRNDGIA